MALSLETLKCGADVRDPASQSSREGEIVKFVSLTVEVRKAPSSRLSRDAIGVKSWGGWVGKRLA